MNNYSSRTPNALQKIAAAATTAVWIGSLALGVPDIRRDVSQPSYSQKHTVYTTGSGSGVDQNVQQIGYMDVRGNQTLSGSYATQALKNASLLATSSTGMIIATSGVGFNQADVDSRYLLAQGDTATGAITINVTGGIESTVGLEIMQMASGAHLFAQRLLSASGGLAIIEGIEAGDSSVILQADNGDDTADVWTITSQATGNDFIFLSGTTEVFNLTTAGALQVDSNLTIGSAGAGVDYTLTFDGETNDGVITWQEDEDRIFFSDAASFSGPINASGGILADSGATIRLPVTVPFTIALHGTDTATGTGWSMTVPASMSGYVLQRIEMNVGRAGTTNSTTVQVKNDTKRTHMLSTEVAVDSGEIHSIDASSQPVIDTSNDDISGRDSLLLYVTGISSTAAKGLFGEMYFTPQ